MAKQSRFRFSIATILWLMICVAAYYGGRNSREAEIEQERQRALVLHEEVKEYRYQNALRRRRWGVFEDAHRSKLKLLQEQLQESLAPTAVDVIDGDTILVVDHGTLIRVRIDGVDSPAASQPFGDEARQFTANFCHKKKVLLAGDDIDQSNGRRADVLVDGKSLREALLKAGLAWHDKQSNDDPWLAELENEARTAKRGLWADDDPMAPWEWPKQETGPRESRVRAFLRAG